MEIGQFYGSAIHNIQCGHIKPNLSTVPNFNFDCQKMNVLQSSSDIFYECIQ